MEEIWKEIDGFNGEYEISNTGLVKSKKFKKEKLLKPNKINNVIAGIIYIPAKFFRRRCKNEKQIAGKNV